MRARSLALSHTRTQLPSTRSKTNTDKKKHITKTINKTRMESMMRVWRKKDGIAWQNGIRSKERKKHSNTEYRQTGFTFTHSHTQTRAQPKTGRKKRMEIKMQMPSVWQRITNAIYLFGFMFVLPPFIFLRLFFSLFYDGSVSAALFFYPTHKLSLASSQTFQIYDGLSLLIIHRLFDSARKMVCADFPKRI